MKKSLLIPVTALILFSCADSMQEYSAMDDLNNSVQTEPDRSHFVSKSDVAALLRAQSNSTRSVSECEDDITCFVDEKHDTLLYACNKADGGWIVYASDTRVPAIIAESPTGTFAEAMENEAAHVWLLTIAEDLKVIKSLSDNKLKFSAEEIENNKAFWKSISSPDEYVKEKLAKQESNVTRGHPLLPTGHYELVNSTSYWEDVDSTSRLITTNWHQDDPFNKYCPLLQDNGTVHADAGCLAIATAQMLYFLHNHFGVPETAPSMAYVMGSVESGYDWDQFNYTSSIWNVMNSQSNAAPLIANIGRRLNMNYRDDGSGAYDSILVDSVFIPYGINATYSPYNTTALCSSLQNGMPVLITVFSLIGTGPDSIGHALIADRYKTRHLVTRNYYVWVYDEIPPGSPVPMHDDKIEYEYSSSTIYMIGMNWGWGQLWQNTSVWYTLTGDWINSTRPQFNWKHSRYMIHGFEVIDN